MAPISLKGAQWSRKPRKTPNRANAATGPPGSPADRSPASELRRRKSALARWAESDDAIDLDPYRSKPDE